MRTAKLLLLVFMFAGSGFFVAEGAGKAKDFYRKFKKREFNGNLNEVMLKIQNNKIKLNHMSKDFFKFEDSKRHESPLLWIVKFSWRPKTLLEDWLKISTEANINFTDEESNTALDIAVAEKKEKVVETLLKFPNIELKFSTLMLAIENKNVYILNMLLNKFKPIKLVNQLTEDKLSSPLLLKLVNQLTEDRLSSPLLLAVRADDLNLVKSLVSLGGVDLNIKNKEGRSPISESKSYVMTQFLLESGAKANNESGSKRFLSAACEGDLKTVKLLKEHDVDIKAIDRSGKNALGLALSRDRRAVADYLLSLGCEVQPDAEWSWFNLWNKEEFYFDFDNRFKLVMLAIKSDILKLNQVPNFFFSHSFWDRDLERDINPLMWLVLNSDDLYYFNLIPGWIEVIRKKGLAPNIDDAIKLAVDKKKPEVKKLLMLQREVNVDNFFEAVEDGLMEYIDAAIEKGFVLGSENSAGQTVMVAAAKSGRLNLIRKFVDLRVGVDSVDAFGRTPLMYAVMQGHLDVSEFLIGSSKAINQKDNDGMTALHFAAAKGVSHIIKLLLDNGAYHGVHDEQMRCPLVVAIQASVSVEVFRALLSVNPNLNSLYKDNWTLLHFAAANGLTHIIDLLVEESDLDVNGIDSNGLNSLMLASKNGHLNTVKKLIRSTKNIDQIDNNGWTALMYAVAGNNRTIVNYLLENGAKVDIINNAGHDAIGIAFQNQYLQIVSLLKGNKKEVIEDKSLTSVAEATLKLARKKLKFKKSLNRLDHEGFTTLMLAINGGKFKSVQELLRSNADVNVSSKDGVSPIVMAINKEDVRMVRELLRYKPDLSKVDMSESYKFKYEIRRMLENAGAKRKYDNKCLECGGYIHGDDLAWFKCGHYVHIPCFKKGDALACKECVE